MAEVLRAVNLQQAYLARQGMFQKPLDVRALNGVSFSLNAGETLAVVGESGCGKSTLARALTLIETPSAGELWLAGEKVNTANKPDAALRQRVQMVFQNPYGSLNPRQKIGDVLAEPLLLNTSMSAAERRDKAMAMLLKVGLGPEHFNRYPHMFSGGQRQRIAIARALMLNPSFLVQDEFGLTYVFISHDLSVVRYIADEVMVMYFGDVVEHGTRDEVFGNPRHAYTQTLFAATPKSSVESIRARLERKKALAG